MCTERLNEMYESVFRESLKDFRVLEDGNISGICATEEEVQRLLDRLKSLGFSYSVRKSTHHRSSNITKSTKSLFFQRTLGNINIKFFGAAFSVESTSQRQCVLGPKYYKKRTVAVPDHLEDHVHPQKKRLLIMDTKKSDCPATLDVKCIRVYPEYTVKTVNEHWETKAKVIKKLRDDLTLPNKPNSYLRFYVLASPANHHTHSCESVEASGTIHPSIVKEIHNLVLSGTTSVKVIKLALDTFVKNNFTYTHTPQQMNTTFYPTERTIYNHVYRAIYGIRESMFDQDSLQTHIAEWCKESSGNKIFFRPYSDVDGTVEPLMFCFQNCWQSELLKKYGDSCLLDATYKTTKYNIPLFFITVQSNVGYLVVGFFFIQVENTKSIHEALEIFRGWNKDWNPKYWVTDFSESEIRAIKQTFPETRVYLCSFHREQAWLRWLRKRGNLTVPGDSGIILDLWRQIAKSATEELYSVHTENFQTHETAHRNPKAVIYLQNQWLTESQKWVKAFEDKGSFGTIHTTNGVEAMNKIVKHFFLKHNADRSLTGVAKILINAFLPSLIRKYCLKNSAIKSYSGDVPLFLHRKTHKFVKHVMKRYSSAETEFSERSVSMISEGLFHVDSSVSRECQYIVNFSGPSCTCEDFKRHRFPCKHFCAIFILYPGWGFEKMQEQYRNRPLICLDEVYGYGLSRSCVAHTPELISSHEVSSDEEADIVNSQAVSRDDTDEVNSVEVSSDGATDFEHHVHEPSNSHSKLLEVRELCKYITNLTYTGSHLETIDENLELLRKCAFNFARSNPNVDGLPLAMPSTSK